MSQFQNILLKLNNKIRAYERFYKKHFMNLSLSNKEKIFKSEPEFEFEEKKCLIRKCNNIYMNLSQTAKNCMNTSILFFLIEFFYVYYFYLI